VNDLSVSLKLEQTVSDQLPLHQRVPQGSVLGPLLFILCTTPLSTLISDFLTCGHHLYDDDTQLFISFTASIFLPISYAYKR